MATPAVVVATTKELLRGCWRHAVARPLRVGRRRQPRGNIFARRPIEPQWRRLPAAATATAGEAAAVATVSRVGRGIARWGSAGLFSRGRHRPAVAGRSGRSLRESGHSLGPASTARRRWWGDEGHGHGRAGGHGRCCSCSRAVGGGDCGRCAVGGNGCRSLRQWLPRLRRPEATLGAATSPAAVAAVGVAVPSRSPTLHRGLRPTVIGRRCASVSTCSSSHSSYAAAALAVGAAGRPRPRLPPHPPWPQG